MNVPSVPIVLSIHETEIKQFGNRNGRNRVEIISTLGHKSRIVETDYEGRNELRGSKRITRVKTNYEGRNELRGSKRITRVETNYKGRNGLRCKGTDRLTVSYKLTI